MKGGFLSLQIFCSVNVIILKVATGKSMLRNGFFWLMENYCRHTPEILL